ncbi:MAG TPA: hypothetical protein DIC46_02265 [Porphyromonadaceae bacterium]|nr:hypothetical protein [Porphyromonadaceae bacterium]HCM19601.1 hypothetical protein [Porphyromonadaceae bacterium]
MPFLPEAPPEALLLTEEIRVRLQEPGLSTIPVERMNPERDVWLTDLPLHVRALMTMRLPVRDNITTEARFRRGAVRLIREAVLLQGKMFFRLHQGAVLLRGVRHTLLPTEVLPRPREVQPFQRRVAVLPAGHLPHSVRLRAQAAEVRAAHMGAVAEEAVAAGVAVAADNY